MTVNLLSVIVTDSQSVNSTHLASQSWIIRYLTIVNIVAKWVFYHVYLPAHNRRDVMFCHVSMNWIRIHHAPTPSSKERFIISRYLLEVSRSRRHAQRTCSFPFKYAKWINPSMLMNRLVWRIPRLVTNLLVFLLRIPHANHPVMAHPCYSAFGNKLTCILASHTSCQPSNDDTSTLFRIW